MASLFGGGSTSNLFGGSTNNTNTNNPSQPAGSSLFGGNQQNQNQTSQQQPTTSSLFGNNQQSQPQDQNQNTQQQAQQGTASLFNTTQQSSTMPSLFQPTASTTSTNPPQTHLSSLFQTGLSNPTHSSLNSAAQSDLAQSRLRALNMTAQPNTKPVYQQIQTLVRKWDPASMDTLLQAYLYNAVNSAYAPFYYRNANEDEKEWEEALAKKPQGIENKDGESVSFVPVLVRGFHALGQRIEYQAKTVNEMRARLHEMNNSLTAVMNTHQQNVTIRLENAKRQHAALAARCLRLAVKAQVLRGKSYPLSQEEETLRRTLMALEQAVVEPSLSAREEEVWARMVALRERARWLEEEIKRVGAAAPKQFGSAASSESGVSEEVILMTKRILKDYEGQLVHLEKELEGVRKEFEEVVSDGQGQGGK